MYIYIEGERSLNHPLSPILLRDRVKYRLIVLLSAAGTNFPRALARARAKARFSSADFTQARTPLCRILMVSAARARKILYYFIARRGIGEIDTPSLCIQP